MGWEDAIYDESVEPHPCRATIKVHKPPQVENFCPLDEVEMFQFQERLQYLEKRYDHLRKLTQTLKRKVNELEVGSDISRII